MAQLSALVALALASAVHGAAFSFAKIFSSGMTLQSADPAARVWGWAGAGTSVAVWQRGFNQTAGAWASPSLVCTAAARPSDGLWIAQLNPTPAGGPYRLEFYATVAGASIANATLDWLWFGDVFLFSGQSNMGIPVSAVRGPANESSWAMEQTLNAYYATRGLQISQGVVATSPQAEISTAGFQLSWAPFSNTTMSGFSAVGAYTSAGFVDAAGSFNNRSVGAIQAEWGGTSINIWLPQEAVEACPTPFNQTAATVEEGPSSPGSLDSSAWNAMIAPLTVGPLAIKGIVWLQGENNVIQGGPAYYACALPALISTWRAAFESPNLFFGVMQLAAYPGENNTNLAEIRDVQLNVTLSTSNTAIASATDLGDLYSPEGSIHPRTKVVNSRRMARAAAGMLYGVPGAQRGPTYAGATAAAGGCVRVAFEPSTVAGGLVLAAPSNLPDDPARLPAFNFAWPAVLGSDGAWRNATWALGAGADSVSLVLCAAGGAPSGVVPVATQFGFGNWPVNVLYNDEGLPAMPWRRWL
jgi:sialate O-acetylesterase